MIYDEIINGTPNTPQRIETIKRADEAYQDMKQKNRDRILEADVQQTGDPLLSRVRTMAKECGDERGGEVIIEMINDLRAELIKRNKDNDTVIREIRNKYGCLPCPICKSLCRETYIMGQTRIQQCMDCGLIEPFDEYLNKEWGYDNE